MLEFSKYRLDELLTVSSVPEGKRPTRVPFLNLRFDAKPLVSTNALCGPGVYGLSFTRAESDNHPVIIYVGKYLGEAANSFSGNVARLRWWTHAGSFTMRGHRIHIAPRTIAALTDRLSGCHHEFQSLCGPDADVVTDRGNMAGLNRALFALSHWDRFGTASPQDILGGFGVSYLRVARTELPTNALRDAISRAEATLIAEMRPIGNGGITVARSVTEAEFEQRSRELIIKFV